MTVRDPAAAVVIGSGGDLTRLAARVRFRFTGLLNYIQVGAARIDGASPWNWSSA